MSSMTVNIKQWQVISYKNQSIWKDKKDIKFLSGIFYIPTQATQCPSKLFKIDALCCKVYVVLRLSTADA